MVYNTNTVGRKNHFDGDKYIFKQKFQYLSAYKIIFYSDIRIKR